MLQVVTHELGHNYGLQHAFKDGLEYGDGRWLCVHTQLDDAHDCSFS